MAMNQAVDTDSISTQVKLDTKSFVDQQNLSSAEIFLFEVPIDKAINDIQLDYCDKKKDTSDEGQCPELIIEWFKFRADGQTNFLSLDELKKSPSPKDPLSTCLKIESTNTERCVVMTSEGSTNDIDIKNSISDDTYHRRVTLKTYLPGIQHPGYHYLFRFRTKDRKNVHFSIYGLRTTGGGTKKKAPLPTAYFESDEVGKTQASFRRIRQQQAVSGGLQDGLEYVHYAHEVGGKNFFKE